MHHHAPLPAPTLAPPTEPTEQMMIDGIAVAPTSRLLALAAIRDGHRSRARGASDRAAELYERIMDCRTRIALIGQRVEPGRDALADADVASLRVELEQITAAREAAMAEASEANAATGEARRLFLTAAQFAADHGATLPATVASELREKTNARLLAAKA